MKPQRDIMLHEDGGYIITRDPTEERKIHTSDFSIAPILGFGFWREFYDEKKIGIGGLQNTLILPFIIIRWGYLLKPESGGGN